MPLSPPKILFPPLPEEIQSGVVTKWGYQDFDRTTEDEKRYLVKK